MYHGREYYNTVTEGFRFHIVSLNVLFGRMKQCFKKVSGTDQMKVVYFLSKASEETLQCLYSMDKEDLEDWVFDNVQSILNAHR